MNTDYQQRIWDTRQQFSKQIQDLYNKYNVQELHSNTDQQVQVNPLQFKSQYKETEVPFALNNFPQQQQHHSENINSISRAQQKFLNSYTQVQDYLDNQSFQIHLTNNTNNQPEIKQFSLKNKHLLLNGFQKNQQYQDPFFTNVQKSRYVREEDLKLDFTQKHSQQIQVYQDCIKEQNVQINKNKFYYNFAVCQQDGELFGINYDILCKEQLGCSDRKIVENTTQITFAQKDDKQREIKYHFSKQIHNIMSAKFLNVDYKPNMLPVKQQSNNKTTDVGRNNILTTKLSDYLTENNEIISNKMIIQENVQNLIRQILNQQKQKLQQIKSLQQQFKQHDNSLKQKVQIQTYDQKFIIALAYKPNYQVNIFKGFEIDSNEQEYQQIKNICPSICHFLVALLAHQNNSNKFREDDLLYSTVLQDNITLNRQSMLIKHILLSIRDKYPKVKMLLPNNASIYECVITALNFMVSPNQKFVLNNNQQTQNSLFDSTGGTITQFTPNQIDLKQFKKLEQLCCQKQNMFVSEGQSKIPINQKVDVNVIYEEQEFNQVVQAINQQKIYQQGQIQLTQLEQQMQINKCNNPQMHQFQHQQYVQLQYQQEKLGYQILHNKVIYQNQQPVVQQQQQQKQQVQQQSDNFIKQEKTQQAILTLQQQLKFDSLYKKLDNNQLYSIISNSTIYNRSNNFQQLISLIQQKSANVQGQLIETANNDEIQQQENDSILYLSQNQIVIINNVFSQQQNNQIKEVNVIKLTPQELNEINLKQLFQQQDTEQQNDDEECDDEIAETIDLLEQFKNKCSVIDLLSPLLGEYQLNYSNQFDNDNQFLYYNTNLQYLNNIAHHVNYQLTIDAQERENVNNYDFNTIQQTSNNIQRINCIKNSKLKVINSLASIKQQNTNVDRYYYRAQERLRYFLLPGCPFSFVINGYKHYVDKVHKSEGKTRLLTQQFKHMDYKKQIPQYITKLSIVMDACGRIPGRFGTREDICDCCLDSHFINVNTTKFINKISCALDRLRAQTIDKEKKIKCANFIAPDKLWTAVSQRQKAERDKNQQSDDWPSDLNEMYDKSKGIGKIMVLQNWQQNK